MSAGYRGITLVAAVAGRQERWVTTGLAVCLGASLMLTVSLTRDPSTQVFSQYAAVKRLAVPIVLIVFLTLLCRLSWQGLPRPTHPKWITLLLGAVALSTTVNATASLLSGDEVDWSALLQGLALFLGFVAIASVGIRVGALGDAAFQRVSWTLIASSAAAIIVGRFGLTPFDALVVPAVFGSALLALRSEVHRGRFAIACSLLLMLFLLTGGASEVYVNSATIAQVVLCAGCLLLFVLPAGFRRSIMLIVGALILILLAQSQALALVSGRLVTSDITVAQRVFEARAVLDGTSQSIGTVLWGLGPSATLNLSSSPDVGTLIAAGRDVSEVDDVHLLVSYLLLKLGAVGVLWALLLTLAIVRTSFQCFTDESQEGLRGSFLLLFVVAGAVNSLPAATNLFTNPLVPLFLGLLFVQGCEKRHRLAIRDSAP